MALLVVMKNQRDRNAGSPLLDRHQTPRELAQFLFIPLPPLLSEQTNKIPHELNTVHITTKRHIDRNYFHFCDYRTKPSSLRTIQTQEGPPAACKHTNTKFSHCKFKAMYLPDKCGLKQLQLSETSNVRRTWSFNPSQFLKCPLKCITLWKDC